MHAQAAMPGGAPGGMPQTKEQAEQQIKQKQYASLCEFFGSDVSVQEWLASFSMQGSRGAARNHAVSGPHTRSSGSPYALVTCASPRID
jgi:hypothetical protein